MSISYCGHCRLPPRDAQALIDRARAARPDWFCGTLLRLRDAAPPPKPFGAESSRGFGIEARSWFWLDVLDKENAWTVRGAAIDDLYAMFGGDLVVTHHLDVIVERR